MSWWRGPRGSRESSSSASRATRDAFRWTLRATVPERPPARCSGWHEPAQRSRPWPRTPVSPQPESPSSFTRAFRSPEAWAAAPPARWRARWRRTGRSGLAFPADSCSSVRSPASWRVPGHLPPTTSRPRCMAESCWFSPAGRCTSWSFPSHPELWAAVVRPHLEIRTKDARRVLGEHVPLKAAVTQWANTAAFTAGLYASDWDLISRSIRDVVAEPLRAGRIPGFRPSQGSGAGWRRPRLLPVRVRSLGLRAMPGRRGGRTRRRGHPPGLWRDRGA